MDVTDINAAEEIVPGKKREEPEINSINFVESLRFFQQQLSGSAGSLDDERVYGSAKTMNGNPSFEQPLRPEETGTDKASVYTGSNILPIPTVDTILESVRILRAIQKSQEQRGTIWSLDVTSPAADELDSYGVLELELQKSLLQSRTGPTLRNGAVKQASNGYEQSGISPDNYSFQHQSSVILEPTESDENAKNLAESFWPSSKAVLVDKSASEVSRTSGKGSLASDSGLTDDCFLTGSEPVGLLSSSVPCMAIPEVPEVTCTVSSGPEEREESGQEYLSCSGEAKMEISPSERSSVEFDSGMGTDKSVGSLSPVRGEPDPEKDVWTDSSHSQYASAEGSPCESLTSAHDILDVIGHEGLETEDITATVCGDRQTETKDRSIYTKSRNDNINENDDSSSVISSTENLVLYESSSRTYMIEQNDPYELENHAFMSKDRLVETIEDRIQQREFEPKARELGVNDFNSDVCTPSPSCNEEVDKREPSTENSVSEFNLEKNSSVPSKQGEDIDGEHETCRKKELSKEEISLSGDSVDDKSESSQPQDSFTGSSFVTGEESESGVHNLTSPCGDDVYVSVAKCVLESAEQTVTVCGTEGAVLEEEPHKTKKNVSASWDPVLLMEHLYHIHENILEDAHKTANCVEGYANVLPVCSFDGCGGCHYLILSENNLDIYESESKEKLLLKVPVQYASCEYVAKDVIELDNKLGRCMRLKFSSEKELRQWKMNLQSCCFPLQSSKCATPAPVHYPLRSHKNVIIIDLGSCSTRAGILMDQPTLPQLFFPTVCATNKETQAKCYGVEALFPEIRHNSTLSFPVRQSAKVTKFTMDIEALQGLFEKIFRELNVDHRQYTVQVSVPRGLSTGTQVALMKLLIEELGVQAVSLTRQALLTLYANNTPSAIVVDVGDRMDVLPVVDGFILECGVSRLPYGGQQIIHHMKHALAQKHISLTNDVESFIVRYIVESLCYITNNYEEELHNAMKFPERIRKSLPLHPFFEDEKKLQTVTLDIGRFQVPEGLFNPDLWGLDFPGLHKLVHQAIQASGMDVRRLMAENIYVSGGVTQIPGFVERLQNEVAKLTLPRLKPQVHASPYRYHMAYLGACQLAASDAFPQVCVSSTDWLKKGPACLSKWHL